MVLVTEPEEMLVAQLVTDSELVLNAGQNMGLSVGQVVAILDPTTRDVHDPKTGRLIGSIDREKCRVRVTKVTEVLSLARLYPPRNRGISATALVLTGGTASERLTSSAWPEGVIVGDPASFAPDDDAPRARS